MAAQKSIQTQKDEITQYLSTLSEFADTHRKLLTLLQNSQQTGENDLLNRHIQSTEKMQYIFAQYIQMLMTEASIMKIMIDKNEFEGWASLSKTDRDAYFINKQEEAKKNAPKTVESLAQISSRVQVNYKFRPEKLLLINGKDYDIVSCSVDYDNKEIDFGMAFFVGGYLFTLEKQSAKLRQLVAPNSGPAKWMICAFQKGTHYTFESTQTDDLEAAKPLFVKMIAEHFLELIYEDVDNVIYESHELVDLPNKQ